MGEVRGPLGERSHTTLMRYKRLAKRRGFIPGAKVKFTKIRLHQEKGENVFRDGTIVAWYPYIFTIKWTNGLLESFRYQQICEGELAVAKGARR